MKIFRLPKKSNDFIATIAIGKEFYSNWKKFALPSWLKYCEAYDLGLIVYQKDLISKDNKYWKKATWQKLLIPGDIINFFPTVNNVCYLDSDILINPIAENVFEKYENDNIGLVSMKKRLPYELYQVLRRVAFLRHRNYSKKYPLDSSLFMSIKDIYDFHSLKVQEDYACMGLILFNPRKHAKLMSSWFQKYNKDIFSITNGGDQTHVNYEIQNWGKVQWLDYRFQALWIYEMAWKYPFLYEKKNLNKNLIINCIKSSLSTNFFLHFAGTWHESQLWKTGRLFSASDIKKLSLFLKYLKTPVYGRPKGLIRPETIKK